MTRSPSKPLRTGCGPVLGRRRQARYRPCGRTPGLRRRGRRAGRRRLRGDPGLRRIPALCHRGLHERLRGARPLVRRLVRRDGQPLRHRRHGRAADRRGRCRSGRPARTARVPCSTVSRPRAPATACRSSAATPISPPTADNSPSRFSGGRALTPHLLRRPARRPDRRGRRSPRALPRALLQLGGRHGTTPRPSGCVPTSPCCRRSRGGALGRGQGHQPGRHRRYADDVRGSLGVGAVLDLDAVPVPAGVPLERWLQTFPSFGYLLAVTPAEADAVIARFARAASSPPTSAPSRRADGSTSPRAAGAARCGDFGLEPLIGCGSAKGRP